MSKGKRSVENPEAEDLEAFVNHLVVAFNDLENAKTNSELRVLKSGIVWLRDNINSLIDQCTKTSHANMLESCSKKLFALWKKYDLDPKSLLAPLVEKIDKQHLSVIKAKDSTGSTEKRLQKLLNIGNKLKVKMSSDDTKKAERVSKNEMNKKK